MVRPIACLAVLVLALTSFPGTAGAKGLTPEQAMAKLKELSGSWSADVPDMAGVPVTVSWKVTAAGSAVMETLFEGAPHEMVSVYFVDGHELRMTHYCAAGNQPRMRLDQNRSSESELVFVFDGGTGFNPRRDVHIHEGRISFTPDGVEERWIGWADGRQSDVKLFRLAGRR